MIEEVPQMLQWLLRGGAMEVACLILLLLALCIVATVAASSAAEAYRNRYWPRLTVPARVAATRPEPGSRRHVYVTFQVESGDCLELCVKSMAGNALSTGDTGRLTFQGSRFMSFEK